MTNHKLRGLVHYFLWIRIQILLDPELSVTSQPGSGKVIPDLEPFQILPTRQTFLFDLVK